MLAWPFKIEQMCEKKLEALEEDEDRYLRQLESDTIALNERLDTNQVYNICFCYAFDPICHEVVDLKTFLRK